MRVRSWLAAAILPLAVTGCVERKIEQGQVKSALVNAGLPVPFAQCMAHRLVDRLTVRQLRKLQALQGPKRTVDDYLAAVEQVNDPQVVQIALGSAALCASGRDK